MTPTDHRGAADQLSPYYTNPRPELAAFLERSRVTLAGRVLEVGCAAGCAGAHWRRLGADELHGIELEPRAAAAAATTGYYDDVYAGTFESWVPPRQAYDTVIFADVLEHLAQPDAVLRRVRSLIQSPSGQLVLSLPNVRHLSVLVPLVLSGDWRYAPSGILDHSHLRFFTTKSARRLLAENGYRVVALERWGFHVSTVTRLCPWLGEFVLSQFFLVAVPCAPGL
jgi:2-polyprenyl-3-methyl-5-hydroxy-6-metoxy-1,4-benzoquinol methylase